MLNLKGLGRGRGRGRGVSGESGSDTMSEDGGGGGAPVPPPPAETPVLTQVLQGLATVMQEMCNTQKQTSAALMEALQGKHGTGASSSSSGASAVSPALKKLQEKSPEFPLYDGNGENFMWWLR